MRWKRKEFEMEIGDKVKIKSGKFLSGPYAGKTGTVVKIVPVPADPGLSLIDYDPSPFARVEFESQPYGVGPVVKTSTEINLDDLEIV